jgi:hypothetical protein
MVLFRQMPKLCIYGRGPAEHNTGTFGRLSEGEVFMGQLRLNVANISRHAGCEGNLARSHSGQSQPLLRPVPRDPAAETIQGTRAFRGLFYASLIAAAFWAAVGAVILQFR